MKEGFPLHDEQIPELLKNIEDHEHDVIDIVMFAIGNARYAESQSIPYPS